MLAKKSYLTFGREKRVKSVSLSLKLEKDAERT